MRLIDAEKLAKNFEGRKKIWFSSDEVLDEIADAESVDAEPVRHGRWIRHETEDGHYSGYDCSECGVWLIFGTDKTPRNCADCGARMDSDKDKSGE